MAGRPLSATTGTFGTIVGTAAMSLLDTLVGNIFTSGFNDSALGWVNYGNDIGSVNAYAVTLPQAPSSYIAGMTLAIKIANTNSGASTINVNSIGSVAIVTPAGNPLLGFELVVNRVYLLCYDGTSFRIVGACPALLFNGSASTNQILECAGCSSVAIVVQFTTGPLNIQFNHLSPGTVVTAVIVNNSGSSNSFFVAGTTPAGTALTFNAVSAGGIGGFSNLTSGAITIPNGQGRIFTGMATTGSSVYLT